MVDYTWVAWFDELATKIAENDERYLADKANDVDWKKDKKKVPLLNYKDENIDPMSFLYCLAQKNTKNQYKRVFGSVHKEFDIASVFPKNLPFIPKPPPQAPALFHDGNSFYPDLLWRLFRQAAGKTPNIEPDDFKAALDIPNVGMVKLTQTLFITNPGYFLPIDRTISTALPQLGSNNDVKKYKDYVKRMHKVKRRFPGCKPYEINTFLDTQAKEHLITLPVA